MTSGSREHCSRRQQLHYHAIIEERTIHSPMCNDPCASGTVESPNTFQRAGNLRNCTFLRGIRTPILGPPKYTCNRHLNRFIHFCTAHDRDQQTDKTQPQTTLQQDMCSNRPHLKRQIVLRCCLKRVCPGQVFTGVGVV